MSRTGRWPVSRRKGVIQLLFLSAEFVRDSFAAVGVFVSGSLSGTLAFRTLAGIV